MKSKAKRFRELLNQIIAKYCRIKVPKKDEVLLFSMQDATRDELKDFESNLRKALESGIQTLVTNINIIFVKTKKSKINTEASNGK